MKPKTIVIVSGLLLMVGAALPWATVTSDFLGISRSITGLEGDGILSALGGLLLFLVGIFGKGKPGKSFSIFGAIVAILCGLLLVSKLFTIATLSTTDGITPSLGFGLSCLSPLGALFGLIGSVMKTPAESSSTLTTLTTPIPPIRSNAHC